MGLTEEEFYATVESMRDPDIWEKKEGKWVMKDSVANHLSNDLTAKASVKQVEDRTLSDQNKHLYFNPNNTPEKLGDERLDIKQKTFKIL